MALKSHSKRATLLAATKTKKQGTSRKKRSYMNKVEVAYSVYIYKVLKQVHPDLGLSNKTMSVLNSFANDIFQRIAKEASFLAKCNHKCTIGSREIQTAVRLSLPGQLSHFAILEGIKAMKNYNDYARP